MLWHNLFFQGTLVVSTAAPWKAIQSLLANIDSTTSNSIALWQLFNRKIKQFGLVPESCPQDSLVCTVQPTGRSQSLQAQKSNVGSFRSQV
jgi:hypothetical protein